MASNNSTVSTTDITDTPTDAGFIAQIVFLIVVLLVTMVGNSLVVVAVILFRRLRSMTHFFVVSLAVSDILVALISLPMRIDQTMNKTLQFGINACMLWLFTDTLCSAASMWNLAVISIDRFLAIHYPFTYYKKMSHKVGFSLIAFVWLFALLWASLIFVKWDPAIESGPHIIIREDNGQCSNLDKIFYTVAAGVVFFLPLITVIFTYGKVFAVALRHARAMAAQRVTGDKRALVHELKATKVLAIVVGAFVVCWLPFWIVMLISLWKNELLANLQIQNKHAFTFIQATFVYFLPVINSTLNPVIYGIFNKDFRAAYKRLLYNVWREKSVGDIRPRNQSLPDAAHLNTSNAVKKRPKQRKNRNKSSEEIELNSQNNNFA